MPEFEIGLTDREYYTWGLYAENSSLMLIGQQYDSKAAVENAIVSVRYNSQIAERFTKWADSSGKFCFNLQAANGQIIAASQNYLSEAARDNGIAWVRKYAPDAEIVWPGETNETRTAAID